MENDIPDAITQLGQCYEIGTNGLVKSAKKAAKIYKRAVELGSVEAMVALGRLLMRGREACGVKMDGKKALQLFRMAADRGDAFGQFNLGLCLAEQLKLSEGFDYLRLAADQGHIQSCALLGVYYEAGEGGIERDTDEARRWYERAVAIGTALDNMQSAIATGKYGPLDGMKPMARKSLSAARDSLDRLGVKDAT